MFDVVRYENQKNEVCKQDAKQLQPGEASAPAWTRQQAPHISFQFDAQVAIFDFLYCTLFQGRELGPAN
jgi:hypothetical protein